MSLDGKNNIYKFVVTPKSLIRQIIQILLVNLPIYLFFGYGVYEYVCHGNPYALLIGLLPFILSTYWIWCNIVHLLYDTDTTIQIELQSDKIYYTHKKHTMVFSAKEIISWHTYMHRTNAIEIDILTLSNGERLYMFEWLEIKDFIYKNKKVLNLPQAVRINLTIADKYNFIPERILYKLKEDNK